MTFVILDACSPTPSLSLFHEMIPLHMMLYDEPKAEVSNNFLAQIDSTLQNRDLLPSDLDFIVVAVGPGSYTGIRVGAAAARGLSFAAEVPVIPVCALHGYRAHEVQDRFFAMIDARIGGVYLQEAEMRGRRYQFIGEPALCALDELAKRLPAEAHIVATNADKLEARVTKSLGPQTWTWEESACHPDYLAEAAKQKFDAGEIFTDGDFPLLYLRKTQAELERAASS